MQRVVLRRVDLVLGQLVVGNGVKAFHASGHIAVCDALHLQARACLRNHAICLKLIVVLSTSHTAVALAISGFAISPSPINTSFPSPEFGGLLILGQVSVVGELGPYIVAPRQRREEANALG